MSYLVKKMVEAMNAAAEAAYAKNNDIPDEEYDGVRARAALRVVREALAEPPDAEEMREAILDVLSNGEGEVRERDMPEVWRAMLAAFPWGIPDMRVRYDVLLRENTRLRAELAAAQKVVEALLPLAPDTRPKTFGGDDA